MNDLKSKPKQWSSGYAGITGAGPGRPKGLQNKATMEFKEGVRKLIEEATPRMVEWLEEIDDPAKRMEIVYKFAQFGHPLLARTEMVGDKDKPLQHVVKWADD